jgi:uncharacterized protein YoxC
MMRTRELKKRLESMNATVDNQSRTIQQLRHQNRILLDEVNLLMGKNTEQADELARMKSRFNRIVAAIQYDDWDEAGSLRLVHDAEVEATEQTRVDQDGYEAS